MALSAALIAFVFAIAAGGFGSLVGIGGGLIIVPVMTIALGYDVKAVIAASLIGVMATSLAASPKYIRSGIADRRLGLFLLVFAAIGGLTGGLAGGLLDARMLSLAFAILLGGVAIQMLRQLRKPTQPVTVSETDAAVGLVSSYVEPTSGELVTYRAQRLLPGAVIAFMSGSLSGLLGVGGGVINVPTLNVLMRVPLRVATTTSTYMLAAIAVTSSVVYIFNGQLDPMLAAPVALGVIVGARGGARLSMHVSQDALRLLFIGVAFFFALGMLGQFLSQ